jgi:hypothetical protein
MVWRRFLAQFASLLFRTPPRKDSKGILYFPPGSLDSNGTWRDSFHSDWYSKHLKAMDEPSLSDANGAPEFAYRFLWLRSFHHPISVRIQRSGASTILHAIELDGQGGYSPGRPARQVNRELSQSELDAVMDRLNKMRFWQMETRDDSLPGEDGAEWILEGSQGGKYHVVNRWSPGTGYVYDLGLHFLRLSGLLPEEHVY